MNAPTKTKGDPEARFVKNGEPTRVARPGVAPEPKPTTRPNDSFTGFHGEDEADQDIDHVLVTPDVGVERVETIQPRTETDYFRPSDHRPVLARVTADPADAPRDE